MLELDVVALADLCSRFLPGMVERGRGAVLNVASTAAFQPLPGQAGYGGAKAFVLSYTRSLAGELKGTGVTATVLCPGPVETDFGKTAGFSKEEKERTAHVHVAPVARGRPPAVVGLDKGTRRHPRRRQQGRRRLRHARPQAAADPDPREGAPGARSLSGLPAKCWPGSCTRCY